MSTPGSDLPSSSSPDAPQPGRATWAPFNPEAPHQAKPRLRAVRGFGMQQGEQTLLGLADARQVSDKVVFTSPAAQFILPHMNGEHTIQEIVEKVNTFLSQPQFEGSDRLSVEIVEQFVAQLDDAALLEGPAFDALLTKVHADFDSSDNLPPSVTAQFAEAVAGQDLGEGATEEAKAAKAPEKLKSLFDTWIAESLKSVDEPSFDALPKAIVAPHLDYPRGWLNYANIYGRLRVVDRPDRVVILGTNHFGFASGVCGCDKGYQTPLGVSKLDRAMHDAIRERLGAENTTKLFAHRFDHEREHSIELQIAWIQHVFAPEAGGEHVPVWAALVHDPAVKGGQSYDGQGLALQPFVDALKGAIGSLPGKTLVVSSADLSHVGPQFGDRFPMGGDEKENPQGVAHRNKTIETDRKMLDILAKRKADELVATMAWQKNPTRWCSVGNLVATMKVVEPAEVRLLNYTAALDQQGTAMVSSVAAAMF